jgi:carbonic anhydrase/acetyltransferase-like protein (isoleucine patch superfamily)
VAITDVMPLVSWGNSGFFRTVNFEKETIMLYRFDGKEPTEGRDSYVSDLERLIGNVIIGSNCYIGHGAILRGDYGRIEIGDGTAVEEGVIIHAPPGDMNRIGTKVTIGHGAVGAVICILT